MTKTKLDDRTINIIAAILAVSNMGQPRPDARKIKQLKAGTGALTLSSAVMYIAEQYMETDEHQHIFETEAKWFAKELRKDPDKCRVSWPDIFMLYETPDKAEALSRIKKLRTWVNSETAGDPTEWQNRVCDLLDQAGDIIEFPSGKPDLKTYHPKRRTKR